MRTLHTMAIGLLAVGLSFGSARTAAAETALGTSAWSLEIGTDVGTGDNDVSFAIRHHHGASSAFRFGVEVDVAKFDGEGTRTSTGVSDVGVEQYSDGYDYALSLQWMRFAPIRNNVAATFALGPMVRMQRSSFSQSTGIGLPSFSNFAAGQRSTTFGLDLGLGVEWFFNPRFSLGGQTGIRALTGSGHQVSIQRSGFGPTYSKTETDVEVDETEITTGTGRIQLTGYF
jgi:hypothetical protein